ncbi:DUF2382 domain-containing protein [Nocardioides sp. 1609]|uniref:YsnF/AvaK domain-containing protein n=1 Tax=Nocardioides sp. 1609 TaxID=2508327 RepID=UPI0010704DD2|nr:DUF2382 domain-containing protein [Nocardioides sp. 1609]
MSGHEHDPHVPAHPGDASHSPDATDRDPAATSDDVSTVRSEERLEVTREVEEAGRVRVRKHVETLPVEQTVERSVEHADTERSAAEEGDTGEVITLADGSVSVPVFEEVLVVTKKLVVRERIVVRKHTVVDEHVLQTELRREHVSVETDGDIEVEDRTTARTPVPPSEEPGSSDG